MSVSTISLPSEAIASLGITNNNIHYQLTPEELVSDTLRLKEGVLNHTGALVIRTGEFTGRCPKDKFIVKDDITADTVHWNDFNIPIDEKYFHIIRKKIVDHLNQQEALWVRDAYACADPQYRLNIRVVNEKPAINLFAYNMFLRPTEEGLDHFQPDWHILSAPGLKLDPASTMLP
jgi:phosphoenolpyruvate carboxykinase (ATP)